jgi:hypothetical protein
LWPSNAKGGRRTIAVRCRRTKPDFVGFVQSLGSGVDAAARTIYLVLDNLNPHSRGSFEEVLGVEAARRCLARMEFHDTPKHASWLNLAEIEIGILDRPCLAGRIGNENRLKASECVGTTAQCSGTSDSMDVHPSGRRPNTGATLCNVTTLSRY